MTKDKKENNQTINQVTQQKHKKEFLLQIMLPIIGFVLLITILWIVFHFTKSGTTSSWSSVSLIFLSLFIILIALVTLLIFVFLTIGIGKLLHILPEKTFIAQEWFKIGNQTIKKYANKIANPFISTKSWLALLQFEKLSKKDGMKDE